MTHIVARIYILVNKLRKRVGVVFSGHHILTAILDDMDKVGMKDATEILITERVQEDWEYG